MTLSVDSSISQSDYDRSSSVAEIRPLPRSMGKQKKDRLTRFSILNKGESHSDRSLSNISTSKPLAQRSGSCQFLSMEKTLETAPKALLSTSHSSGAVTVRAVRETTKQESSPSRSATILSPRSSSSSSTTTENNHSPREGIIAPFFNWLTHRRNSEPSIVDIISQEHTPQNLDELVELECSTRLLADLLKPNETKVLSPRCVTWRGHSFRFNTAEISEAIISLHDRLKIYWDTFSKTCVNVSTLKMNHLEPQILYDVHGQKVSFTFKQENEPRLEKGGFHSPYIVVNEAGKECLLLIAHEPEITKRMDPKWNGSKIEAITWREETTRDLTIKGLNFFPEHYHTFVLGFEICNEPLACYMIELLETLKSVKHRITFCQNLIHSLTQLHAKRIVHGDVSKDNIRHRNQMPVFIDVDPYCFLNIELFLSMTPIEQKLKWDEIKQTGTNGRYMPPKFRAKLSHIFETKDPHALEELLKLKDRFGLAISIWEICRCKKIEDLQPKKETSTLMNPDFILSKETYSKLVNTTNHSEHLTPELKSWIISELKEGFELSDDADLPVSESHSSSMNSSSSSATDTSVAKQATLNLAD